MVFYNFNFTPPECQRTHYEWIAAAAARPGEATGLESWTPEVQSVHAGSRGTPATQRGMPPKQTQLNPKPIQDTSQMMLTEIKRAY